MGQIILNNLNPDIIAQLFTYVKSKINLADFIETTIGGKLRKNRDDSFSSNCPMPHHKDSVASFNVRYNEEEGIWWYHCFGCNSGGTIIDFCKDYYGFKDVMKCLIFLAEKYKLDEKENIKLENLTYNKKVNTKKKAECAHIVASSQCLRLLRKNYDRHSLWVSNAYKEMNEALDCEDITTIENIGFKALKKISEKEEK